jgi:hypothetical protein
MGLSRNNVSDKGQYIQLQETDDQVFALCTNAHYTTLNTVDAINFLYTVLAINIV